MELTIFYEAHISFLKVHRSVLAARSLVFRRMLENQPKVSTVPLDSAAAAASWSESGSGIISIPDVGEDVMRHFLLYLYGSQVPVDMDEQLAEELLVIADKYDVERLKSACEVALSKIDPRYACEKLMFYEIVQDQS